MIECSCLSNKKTSCITAFGVTLLISLTMYLNSTFGRHDSLTVTMESDSLFSHDNMKTEIAHSQRILKPTKKAKRISAALLDPSENSARCSYVQTNTTLKMMAAPKSNNSSKLWQCDQNSTICSDILDLNIPKTFLPNYVNPCWYDESDHLRCLPYYFLAGFPKCGTTDLHYKIGLHPNIILSRSKEPHWWTRRRFGKHRQRDDCSQLEWPRKMRTTFHNYLNNFEKTVSCLESFGDESSSNAETPIPIITGEASASTFWDNQLWHLLPGNENEPEPRVLMAHHIHYYLPGSKVIVILRNPVDRLFSDYLYFWDKADGQPTAKDFHTKVNASIYSMKKCIETSNLRSCVYSPHDGLRLHIGIYSVYIKDWLKVFPRSQLHILQTESYNLNTLMQLNNIFSFLGLGTLPEKEAKKLETLPKKINSRKKHTQSVEMLKETKRILAEFYQPFNLELVELTGNDAFHWADKQS